ncbi:hypothetical protein HNP10_000682 [Aeromonas veronii]|uniref:DUF1566 domain-containing protein n=1 Tax=Aeromonas veronii TaxID=654 RepID=UPI001621C2D9|nr:DUF1566 domain-containing protein [Aeromonas veronii]MCS3831967.1 hypothetical protein [Aeromonas veronii]
MHPFFPLLLLIATLVPVTSQARECLPGYQEEISRYTTEWIDMAGHKIKVVNDQATNLQWFYCPYGQSANNDKGCDGLPVFIDSKATLADNPLMSLISKVNKELESQTHPWRAPDVKELFTLYNNQCQPAIYLAHAYPSTQQLEQIEGDKAQICAKAEAVWNEQTEEFIDADPELVQACRLAERQAYALQYLSFSSDSSSGSGYNYLNFARNGETFFSGGIGSNAVMLRLVRPIPTAATP